MKYSRTCMDVLDSEQSSKPFAPTHEALWVRQPFDNQESEEYDSLDEDESEVRMKPSFVKRRVNPIHSSIDSSFALDTTEEENKEMQKSSIERKKEKIEAEKKEKQF